MDVAIREEVTQTNYGHTSCCSSAARSWATWRARCGRWRSSGARAERHAAAAAERARLARAVHDGVLQVLSLVQRRGAEATGDAGAEFRELGRLAAEQESRPRSLIRAQDTLSEVAATSPAESGRTSPPPWSPWPPRG